MLKFRFHEMKPFKFKVINTCLTTFIIIFIYCTVKVFTMEVMTNSFPKSQLGHTIVVSVILLIVFDYRYPGMGCESQRSWLLIWLGCCSTGKSFEYMYCDTISITVWIQIFKPDTCWPNAGT